MKSSMMRPVLALALALGLAACGSKAEFPVTGTVSGLQYPHLVLTTNGMDLAIDPPVAPATTVAYSFPQPLQYGDDYAVTVKTPPDHQVCVPVQIPNSIHPIQSGIAGQLAKIDVPFSCSLATHTIGGTVTGLTADGLVLTNGSTGGTVTVAKATTTDPVPFTFAAPVTYNQSYGVAVLTQPAGLACSVANGTGVMGDQPVTNIGVTCTSSSPPP